MLLVAQGRLDELMSQMRMQNQIGTTLRPDVAYHIDVHVQHEIKQVTILIYIYIYIMIVVIIRPHHSTTYVDAVYCYQPSVCHTSELCKNRSTDRGAIWIASESVTENV